MRAVTLLTCLLSLPLFASQNTGEAGGPLAGLILKHFDLNTDEKLDAGEWQEGLRGSFSSLDADADGLIQISEVDALREDIAEDTGELVAGLVLVVIRSILSSLDSDGDKAVSREEFGKLSTELFTRMDADKDGTLSREELASLPAKLSAAKAS
jgi:Ca2+-binding EF-hand superfamily protein